MLSLAAWAVGSGRGDAEVLLLSNGSLVEGRVEPAADELIVHQGDGAVRLRTAAVAATVRSRTEAYEWLRTRELGSHPEVGDHLRLADWAMRHQMWPQAARELLEAKQLSPNHPRLRLLQRRLAELSRLPEAPVAKPAVIPVAAHEETAPQAATREATPDLPAEGLEYFTRRIQPVLLNGCATAGCHRGQEGDPFPLDRSLLHGYGNAAATDRNLRTALGAIDLAQPDASSLLAAARGPHAGVTPLGGLRRDELLNRLARWATSVAVANGWDVEAEQAIDGEAAAEADVVAEASEPPAEDSPGEETATLFEPRPLRRGVQLTQVGPRDEFDPAIFNERHRRPEDDDPAPPR